MITFWYAFIGLGVIAAIFAVNETKFWLNDSKTLNDYKLAVFLCMRLAFTFFQMPLRMLFL